MKSLKLIDWDQLFLLGWGKKYSRSSYKKKLILFDDGTKRFSSDDDDHKNLNIVDEFSIYQYLESSLKTKIVPKEVNTFFLLKSSFYILQLWNTTGMVWKVRNFCQDRV